MPSRISLPVDKQTLVPDFLAGLVIFLVGIPVSLGIAQASGAPASSGLIAGIVGGLLVGFLSGSQTSISGPGAGLIAIIASQMALFPSFRAFLLAVLVAGLIQVLLGVLRAGFLAAFIPSGVVKGLIAALGIILVLKQIPHLVGHDTDPEGDLAFIQPNRKTTFSELFAMTGDYHIGAAVIGVCSAAFLLFCEVRDVKLFKRFPAPLLVTVLAIAAKLVFDRIGGDWEVGSDHLVYVPLSIAGDGFANLFIWPDFSFWNDINVYNAALLIAIVASFESLIIVEALDQLDTHRRRTSYNRELFAQGIGNATCGLIGGLPITSSIVNGCVGIRFGAQTKQAAIFNGLFFLTSILLIARFLNHIPISCLAAILFVTGIHLASPRLFYRMWNEGREQFIPFLVTLVAIVFTDLWAGAILGLLISIAFILYSNLQRPLRRIVETHLGGEVFHIELANQVSFLNRGVIDRELTRIPAGTHVLLDATNTQYIDPDILSLIREYKDEIAPQHGIQVSLKGFHERYQLKDEIQFMDYSTRELQERISPTQVLRILQDGNERFRTGLRLSRDLNMQMLGSSVGQHPLAVVLSCIDSRTPGELVFDLGLGDIFSVRVAGNVAGPKVLGSIEYSTAVAGAKLVVVMGHTNCGAVNAAVKLAHAGQSYEAVTGCEHLEPIIDRISTVYDRDQWLAYQAADDVKKVELANEVGARNVVHVVKQILEESGTIRRLVDEGKIAVIGAMYDVGSGNIRFFIDEAFGVDPAALDRPAPLLPQQA